MRKNLYFLQLYLTGIFTSTDELQNKPHNACRIRNDPALRHMLNIIADFHKNGKIILFLHLNFFKILYGTIETCINYLKKSYKFSVF